MEGKPLDDCSNSQNASGSSIVDTEFVKVEMRDVSPQCSEYLPEYPSQIELERVKQEPQDTDVILRETDKGLILPNLVMVKTESETPNTACDTDEADNFRYNDLHSQDDYHQALESNLEEAQNNQHSMVDMKSEPEVQSDSIETDPDQGKFEHGIVKKHKCSYCDYSARYKHNLIEHVKYTHDDNAKMYHCSYCDYTTKRKSNFTVHVKHKHNECPEMHKCELCDYTTRWKRSISEHMRYKHDDNARVYKCRWCDHTTKLRSAFRKHVKRIHGHAAEIHECSLCDYATNLKKNLIAHVAKEHGEPVELFRCDRCSYATKWKRNLTVHYKFKHTDSAPSDNSDAQLHGQLMGHIKIELVEPPKKMMIETQSEVSLKKTATRKNKNEELHRCKQCVYETKSKINFVKHLKYMHNDSAEVHQCEHCDYLTAHKSCLDRHVKCKHDVNAEVFHCEHCSYATKWRRAYTRHVKNHVV